MTLTPNGLLCLREIPLRPCIGTFKFALEFPVMVVAVSPSASGKVVSEFMDDRSKVYVSLSQSYFSFGPPRNVSTSTAAMFPEFHPDRPCLEVPSQLLDDGVGLTGLQHNLLELRPSGSLPLVHLEQHACLPFKDHAEPFRDDETILPNEFSDNEETARKCAADLDATRAYEKFGATLRYPLRHWPQITNEILDGQKLSARNRSERFFKKHEMISGVYAGASSQ